MGEDLQVEFLIELAGLALDGDGQQLIAKMGQDPVIAQGVFTQGVKQRCSEQVGVAGLPE